MKELAKQYKAGDTSVVAQLKDLTAKKKQLEKQLEKDVAGKNRNQQLDTNIDEAEGKSLQDLEMGEKFTFNGKEYTFIELYPELKDAAKVIRPDGEKSVMSFGGGRVNTGKKAGIGPDAFGQGKGHHID